MCKLCLPKVERDELQLLLHMPVDQLCESLFKNFEVDSTFSCYFGFG